MVGIEPWLIELFSLALTVEALHGKTCQDSLLSGRGRSLWAKISGGRVVPGEYFLVSTKLDTFCCLTVQTSPCYVPSFWHNTGVWQTDGRTDRRMDRRTDGRNCRSYYSACSASIAALCKTFKANRKSYTFFPTSHQPRFYSAPNFLKMGIKYLNLSSFIQVSTIKDESLLQSFII